MLLSAVRRAAISAAMLVAVSLLVFVTWRLLPGDPTITRFGATLGVTSETLAATRHQLGLDQPVWLQYWQWLVGVLHGDLGQSYFSQFSVTTLIEERAGPTIELAIAGTLLNIAISIPAGIVAGVYPRSLAGRAVNAYVSVGMATPQAFLGILLVLVFGLRLGWFPLRGYVAFSDDPLSNLTYVFLPAATLAIAGAPIVIRFLRASIVEVLASRFVRTAIGKGLPRYKVVWLHVLPNALLPALTMLGIIVAYTLGGVVVVERIFGWPGLGSLAVDAVAQRDYGIMQAIVVITAATFLATNLAVDLAYLAIDPRLRNQSRA